MKSVIVGGNPAGLSAASSIRRLHPDWEIQVYEKYNYMSYGSCGLPYYIADLTKNLDDLVTISHEEMKKNRNIDVHLNHEVLKIDFIQKTVEVHNKTQNIRYTESYDQILIATGAKAQVLPVTEKIRSNPHYFQLHTMENGEKLKTFLQTQKIESVVVIGGGYIGLEMLEAYRAYNIKDITVITLWLPFKSEMDKKIQQLLTKHQIKLILDRKILNIQILENKKFRIFFNDESFIDADLIQESVGIVPNTSLVKDSSLELGENGAILIDKFGRTNLPDVYAAGDCATIYHRLLQKQTYFPLAPAANKIGRIVGNVMAGNLEESFPGVVGTLIFKVFDLYCAKTGLSLEEAQKITSSAERIQIEHHDVAHYYPNNTKMAISLIFDTLTHQIMGAEITAPSARSAKKIDVLATGLTMKMTIDQLQEIDLAYAPPFSPVWDPILIAANIAQKKCK